MLACGPDTIMLACGPDTIMLRNATYRRAGKCREREGKRKEKRNMIGQTREGAGKDTGKEERKKHDKTYKET